nr:hypothetical protein Iba_chr13eCG12860 [Ipomoea batatas]
MVISGGGYGQQYGGRQFAGPGVASGLYSGQQHFGSGQQQFGRQFSAHQAPLSVLPRARCSELPWASVSGSSVPVATMPASNYFSHVRQDFEGGSRGGQEVEMANYRPRAAGFRWFLGRPFEVVDKSDDEPQ